LAHFENGIGKIGSFLDVGSHRFYVAKPFPKEVIDVFDPLCDGGSSCGGSSSLGAMVEVMALGEEEGGDSLRPERPSPERLLPQEQDAPLPEQDAPDVSVVDLRAPLSRIINPARVVEALERTRLVLLSKVAEDKANRCCASTTLSEFYDVHGNAPTEHAHDPRRSFATAGPGQIQRSPSASRGDVYARHLLGLQVQRFVEQQQVSLKWITQGLSNSGRKRSKLSLSINHAIMIQKVSCVPNTPNTLVRCIGAIVWRRDSEIQVV
jgi:hypothetical protein